MTDPESIVDAVRGDATMSSLIDGRIYPIVLPPNIKDPNTDEVLAPILPAITYQLISQPMMVTQESNQYRTPRWRFHIWSLIYADLIPIAVGLAAIFGDQSRTPFPSSRIEYPSSRAEDHESDTHRYWRAFDVVVGLAPAGSASQ